MKAFLLYRSRDFDSGHLLVRREQELHRRNPDPTLNLEPLLPWNEAALVQDLGLQLLFNAMAGEDNFLFDAARLAVLTGTNELDTILYRQNILTDCIKNEATVREIYQIASQAIAGERKNYWSYAARSPSGIVHRSVGVLEMFVVFLKRLRELADTSASQFISEGFTRLFAMLQKELSDDYFGVIDDHLRQLQFRRGVLISAELGRGNKGKNYVLRRPHRDNRAWLVRIFGKGPPGYTFQLHPRDETGARAFSDLRDRGLNLVGNALAQSTDHILSFFQMLKTELAFYIGCLNLHTHLRTIEGPACLPSPFPPGSKRLSFAGLYDVSLALSKGAKVIGNTLGADGKALFIITGANTGGKSTFLRSIGLAQLMMQAGMFVAAENFSAELCAEVVTHYKRKEDTTMESGKWDEELNRMSENVDHLKSDALMLFNESFASTNEREGSEIASQIVKALLDKNVKVFFVTHLYHFANGFYENKYGHAIYLRAERRADGTRPFKLIESGPLQTSYGEDLYRKIFSDGGQRNQRQIEMTS